RAVAVALLPRRRPLGAETAEQRAVVQDGAQLARSMVEAKQHDRVALGTNRAIRHLIRAQKFSMASALLFLSRRQLDVTLFFTQLKFLASFKPQEISHETIRCLSISCHLSHGHSCTRARRRALRCRP